MAAGFAYLLGSVFVFIIVIFGSIITCYGGMHRVDFCNGNYGKKLEEKELSIQARAYEGVIEI